VDEWKSRKEGPGVRGQGSGKKDTTQSTQRHLGQRRVKEWKRGREEERKRARELNGLVLYRLFGWGGGEDLFAGEPSFEDAEGENFFGGEFGDV